MKIIRFSIFKRPKWKTHTNFIIVHRSAHRGIPKFLKCPKQPHNTIKHAPSGAIWVGLSLDPEGRKRLLVRVSSFALKKREKIRNRLQCYIKNPFTNESDQKKCWPKNCNRLQFYTSLCHIDVRWVIRIEKHT